MEQVRIIEYIDIQAPREEVFRLVIDIRRRMQLSPLWGVAKLVNPSHDYPNPGSSYDVEIQESEGSCFETIITDFKPEKKFAYQSILENRPQVIWNFQEIKSGTRLTYTEEFLADETDSAELREMGQKIIRDWLKNLQRYAELRQGFWKQLARWVADHFYLNLQPDQRRMVLAILVMQFIGFVSFVMAAVAFGIASLFL